MAHVAGMTGAVYARKFYTKAATISFADTNPDTILDSAAGFSGAEAGDYVTVSGAAQAGNNDTFLIGTALPATLTLDAGETLTAEAAGATVTVSQALPYEQLLGFNGIDLNLEAVELETTDFTDVGASTPGRHYIAGLTSFNATCTHWWASTDLLGSWTGAKKYVAFFVKYNSAPATTTCYYYHGYVITTGLDTSAPVDTVVAQPLTLQGTGTITSATATTAWPT